MVEFLSSLGLEPRHLGLLSKWVIAVAATALLARRTLAPRPGSPAPSSVRADRALVLLAALAFVSWWHVGGLKFGTAFHRWEFFHYYLGAKYSPELEYTRLYDCTAAAEAEDDPSPNLLSRRTRNLRTNVLEQGSPAARDPELCRSRFTPARWQEFKHDALWFRREARGDWLKMQVDHGYNATPVWNAAGHLLTNTGPASKRQMVALALIDPVLIATMWIVVWWAFGWRAMAVAVIFWGTNFPAKYFYLGASFLRSDWLVMSVIGIALAKRGYLMLAGAALGWSTLLRIFPGFLTSGAALKLLQRPVWRDDSARGAVRLLAGASIAVAVLISFSFLSPRGGVTEGVERWRGFVENSRKHLSGSSVNRVGLTMLALYLAGKRLPESQPVLDRITRRRLAGRKKPHVPGATRPLLGCSRGLSRASGRGCAWTAVLGGIDPRRRSDSDGLRHHLLLLRHPARVWTAMGPVSLGWRGTGRPLGVYADRRNAAARGIPLYGHQPGRRALRVSGYRRGSVVRAC